MNMDWRKEFTNKVKVIKEVYEDAISRKDPVAKELTEKENKHFLSMKRWHQNWHTTDEILLMHLNKVVGKGLLNVRNKMEKIPVQLEGFLIAKFKKTGLKERFIIHDLFENILPDVMKLFKEKLDENDSEDEFSFDLENIVGGIPSSEVDFYKKVFTPAAVFYIYESLHNDYLEMEELIEDTFTLGAGAMTDDLIPELTPFCPQCLDTLSSEQIEIININVFKLQKLDEFQLNLNPSELSDVQSQGKVSLSWYDQQKHTEGYDGYESCDEENDALNTSEGVLECRCTDCGKIFSRLDFLEYHKLLFHNESEVNLEVGDVDGDDQEIEVASTTGVFGCQICGKVFSRLDFVEYHKSVFHDQEREQTKKSVIPLQFVDEGLELMTTFCVESTPEKEERKESCSDGEDSVPSKQKVLRTRRELNYPI